MPSGYVSSPRRSNYRKAGRSARGARTAFNRTAVRVPRRNTYNKPVAAALRKPRRRSTKVNRNRSAITTLGRQVQLLKSQKFGILQSQTQFIRWAGTVAPTALPQPAQPIAFLINDFYEQTCFRGLVTGTTATFEDSAQFLKQTYDAALDDQYEWNARMNTDVVSPNAYLPVYTRINLRFNFRMTGVTQPGNMRIDIVKNRMYNATNKINSTLPGSLGAYRNLCLTPSDPNRNYYNPEFHQVISTQWIRVTNPCRSATESAQFFINRQITRKFSHRDFVDPEFNTNPTGQTFWTNCPRNQQTWLIISLDQTARDMLQTIEGGRFLRWRDHHAQA